MVPERHAAYRFHSAIASYRWADDARSLVRSSRKGRFNVYIPSFICRINVTFIGKRRDKEKLDKKTRVPTINLSFY